MSNDRILITAAGGNGTAIQVLDRRLRRDEYARIGNELLKEFESKGAEQAGFLILEANHQPHFEMAGGEFCGNASRAAALLISERTGCRSASFTVSGFPGEVWAMVEKQGDNTAVVRCEFPGMSSNRRSVEYDGQEATIVDLGGIVHVVIEGSFPEYPAEYKRIHRAVCKRFKLTDRDAVGVIWYEQDGDAVTIYPVVWVREVDTFFYESSCGSGAIAAGKVAGAKSIIQPTGKPIEVQFSGGVVVLKSEMEVVR